MIKQQEKPQSDGAHLISFPLCDFQFIFSLQLLLCVRDWLLVTKTEMVHCFSVDPFADATKGDDLLPAGTEDKIHIRIQQRNGRKTLTTVQGISDDYDKKKLVKAFKKKFACNGTVIEHPEYGEVIQLQGDQRKNICQFLMEINIVKEEQLKVHGF
ncbi:eukaryotic translation initiation factor 1-like [Sinocyclocheilus grahami]|nr:PREDICTED: eukaryotic translation initiation factor 1-like [Sinocyclocheilus grahami]